MRDVIPVTNDVLTINGRTSRTKPNRDLLINRHDRFEPPIINGQMPADVVINGLNRPPVLSGCVLNLPLYHPYLSVAPGGSFNSLDAYGHSCAVTGALWRPDGRYFDGDDKITVPDVASLDVLQTTILFWLNSSDLINTIGVASKRNDTNDQNSWDILSGLTDNRIRFQVTSGGTGATAVNVTNDSDLAESTWYCLAFRSDGTDLRIYKDGVLDCTPVAFAADIFVGTADLLIGDVGGTITNFLGSIGSFLQYNRALSPAEILDYYNGTMWRYQ